MKALVSLALERAGFVNGFSTRLGGVSPLPENALSLAGFDDDSAENIHENRRRFLSLFDGDWQLASCWQIHSADVRAVSTEDEVKNDIEKCDGIISQMPGVLAGVKTADCVPVLIGDPQTGAFAAVHAGWRGTSSSIVKTAVEKMRAGFGSQAEDLIAAIGPAALGCCYEVGSEVIAMFRENFPEADELLTPTSEGHALIDLHKANKLQLIAAGVPPENIYLAPLCTMDRADLFFSHRRENKAGRKTGRLMSVIGRR